MLPSTHMHILNARLLKARTTNDENYFKKGLQKNKMMSKAKQDWDGESQNTLGGIWTLKTN